MWGDLKDRASLDAAVAGVDTVITTANGVKRGGEDTIETVDRQGTLNLIDAAQKAGVGRFLYTSVQGATLDNPNRLWQIKGECEQAVKQGGWTYTIVQPSIFMEVWIGMVVGMALMSGQPINLIGRGDHAHNFIAEQDVTDDGGELQRLLVFWRQALGYVRRHRASWRHTPLALFALAISLTEPETTVVDGVEVFVDERLPKPPAREGQRNLRERHTNLGRYVRPMLRAAGSRPVGVGVFGGRLEYGRLPWWGVLFVMGVIRAPAGDRRNWGAMEGWAESLAERLGTAEDSPAEVVV